MIAIDTKMPRRQTLDSAGYDFYAPEDIDVDPDVWIRFDSRVRFTGEEKVIPSYYQWAMLIVPRSSLGMRYGFKFSNTVSVIDQDYRNTIKFSVSSDIPFTIKKGERFAQGIIVPFGVFSDEIKPTKERNGGIGSTGQ